MPLWLLIIICIIALCIYLVIPMTIETIATIKKNKEIKEIKETNITKILDLSAKGICDHCMIGKENCIGKGYPICKQYGEEDDEK